MIQNIGYGDHKIEDEDHKLLTYSQILFADDVYIYMLYEIYE